MEIIERTNNSKKKKKTLFSLFFPQVLMESGTCLSGGEEMLKRALEACTGGSPGEGQIIGRRPKKEAKK